MTSCLNLSFSIRSYRKRGAFLLLAAVMCSLSPVAEAGAEKPPVQSFFTTAVLGDVQLSPDGDYVAMLVLSGDKHKKLAVKNLVDGTVKIAASSPDVDISNIYWVNNRRLCFSTVDRELGNGETRLWPGLFAVNRDGSEMVTLAERGERSLVGSNMIGNVLSGNTYFKAVDPTGTSDDIFVEQPVYTNLGDFKALNLLRLNTRTGISVHFQRPGDTRQWVIAQDGVPRLNVTDENGQTTVFYMAPGESEWKKIASFAEYDSTESFSPDFFDGEGTLYVVASRDQDTSSLYRYDFVNHKIADKPLVSIQGYDFEGDMLIDRSHKKLLGLHFQTDAWSTYWFDEERKKIQKAVDALLPATNNFLQFARSGNAKNILVVSHSDIEPGHYMIYDTSSGELSELGASRPQIDPKQMSHQTMVHYAARDGLQIPAYLTMPRGAPKKDLPMVVIVHGGPFVRGASWGWDPEVQFLASRGYAVLQPEFRGSTGFGSKFAKAGWKQWGLAMQNDVADGAKWAIAQGIADPKRICIAGASYGGYATLMGLANDPDLFKCGVDWVGVTDINLMYQVGWANDLPPDWQHFGMPLLIGDQVKDAEQLRVTSPVNIADRIRQPILMAYGGSDRRVPIEHGRKFRDAVQRTNDKVEWIEYPEEGHGWRLMKNNVDFWSHVEKFLDANIGH